MEHSSPSQPLLQQQNNEDGTSAIRNTNQHQQSQLDRSRMEITKKLLLKMNTHLGERTVGEGNHQHQQQHTKTSSNEAISTRHKKLLRQPKLAQANSVATQPLQEQQQQRPQPLIKEFALTEDDIKKIDSALTNGHLNMSTNGGGVVGGGNMKPIYYFISLGCVSFMVILFESFVRDRRSRRPLEP